MLNKISHGVIDATYTDVSSTVTFSSGDLLGKTQENLPRKMEFNGELFWANRGDKVIHVPSMGTDNKDDFDTYFVEQHETMIMMNGAFKVLAVFKNRT